VPRLRRPPASIRIPPIWRRRPLLAAVVLMVSLLLAYERLERPADRDGQTTHVAGDYARYHHQVFEVIRVIDGDTVRIDAPDGSDPTTSVRLWGVDCPETARSPGGAGHYGAEASAFATRRLLGRQVRLELVPDDTRGRYGRLLAYVCVEPSGVRFNELLLEHGYAYADPRFAHPRKARFAKLEADARARRAGLWAEVTPADMPPWRR